MTVEDIEDIAQELDDLLRQSVEAQDGQAREILQDFSKRLGRPVSTLYVLDASTDPFYIGDGRLAGARWFSKIWHQLEIPEGYHLRRIHYRMISQTSPLPYWLGGFYENTYACWAGLINASRDAVASGLIPSNAFVDRRNPKPIIFLAQSVESQIEDLLSSEAFLPPARFLLPALPRYGEFIPGVVPQPYHVEVWAEKSTMNDILIPLARQYQVNLITGVGELSYIACRDFIRRLDDRPARIIYISDFDPSGQSMPVAVSRKIEYELYRQGLGDKDVEVRHCILTHAQCRQYQLPRTPIKETDLRGKGFEKRFGEGATELDALEALHPGVFRRIVRTEILRYWNPEHDKEVQEQIDAFKNELSDTQNDAYGEYSKELDGFRAEVRQLNEQLVGVNEQAKDLLERMKPQWQALAEKLSEQQPVPEIECPEFEADEDADALFDSMRQYVEQVDRYKEFQAKPTERKQRQTKTKTIVRPTNGRGGFQRGPRAGGGN